METKAYLNILHGAEKRTSLAELPPKLEQNCQNCPNSTPVICVGTCKTWKLKNQLRSLHKKSKTFDFMTKLLNTLKNKRRIQILERLSKERQSISQLQQKLRKEGYNHSQRTMIGEYISPLMNVGLVEENYQLYSLTLFGYEVSALIEGSQDIGEALPPHSECYEETTLNMLKNEPKTFQELSTAIPTKSLARVLNRLRKQALIETKKDKDYVFFFKTKRNSYLEEMSLTEKRVYENIPEHGIAARKLANKARISLRRTYKYLRKLKGKKLVFVRKKPMVYTSTPKGKEVTTLLERLRELIIETQTAAATVANGESASEQPATKMIDPFSRKI